MKLPLAKIEERWHAVIRQLTESETFKLHCCFSFLTFSFSPSGGASLVLVQATILHLKAYLKKLGGVSFIASFEYSSILRLHLVLSRCLTDAEFESLRLWWIKNQGFSPINNYCLQRDDSDLFAPDKLWLLAVNLKKALGYLFKPYRITANFEAVALLFYVLFPQDLVFGGGPLNWSTKSSTMARFCSALMRLIKAQLFLYYDCPVPSSYFSDHSLKGCSVTLSQLLLHWESVEFKSADKEVLKFYDRLRSPLRTKEDLLGAQLALEKLSRLRGTEEFHPVNLLVVKKSLLRRFMKEFQALLEARWAETFLKKKSFNSALAAFVEPSELFCYSLDSLLSLFFQKVTPENPITKEREVLFPESTFRGALLRRLRYSYFVYPAGRSSSPRVTSNYFQQLKQLQAYLGQESNAEEVASLLKKIQEYSAPSASGVTAVTAPWYNEPLVLSFLIMAVDMIVSVLYDINFLQTKGTQVSFSRQELKFCAISPDIFLSLFEERLRYRIHYPFLLPPIPFRPVDGGRIIGGYHTPAYRELLFNFQPFLNSFVGNKFLATVNHLQTNCFQIHQGYLDYLVALDLDQLEQQLAPDGGALPFNLYHNQISGQAEKLTSVGQLMPVFEFFLSLFLAKLFSKQQGFYFVYFLDKRFRLYLRAYPLNFFAHKLCRPLFLAAEQKPLTSLAARHEIFQREGRHYLKTTELPNRAAFLCQPDRCLVGLDASSQIYQLIGGLLLSKKILRLTHVVPLAGGSAEKPPGLYEHMLGLYAQRLEDFWPKRIAPLFNSLKEKVARVFSQHMVYELLAPEVFREKLNRRWIKGILMTYGYNKSVLEIINDNLSTFFPTELLSTKIFKNSCFSIVKILVVELIALFKSEFPSLDGLNVLFRQISGLGTFLQAPLFVSFTPSQDNARPEGFVQFYYKEPVIKLQKYRTYSKEERALRGGRRGANVTQRIPLKPADVNGPLRWNRVKNEKALLPNTIHHLDALLLAETVERLVKENIFVQPLHDSFYVSIDKAGATRQAYGDSYARFFRQDLLGFLLVNLFRQWGSRGSESYSALFCEALAKGRWGSLPLTPEELLTWCSDPPLPRVKGGPSAAEKTVLRRLHKLLELYGRLRVPADEREAFFQFFEASPRNPFLLSY